MGDGVEEMEAEEARQVRRQARGIQVKAFGVAVLVTLATWVLT